MNIEVKIVADSVEELQAALEKLGKKSATHITVIPDDPRIENGELTIPAGTDLTIAKVSLNDVQLTAAPDPQPMQMPEPAAAPEKPKRTRKAAKAPESPQEPAGEPEAPQAVTTPAEPEKPAEAPWETVADSPAAAVFAAENAPTLDEIANAGARLLDADAGKMMPLLNLLQEFGVQAITQLKDDQLAEFAERLRGLGAEV